MRILHPCFECMIQFLLSSGQVMDMSVTAKKLFKQSEYLDNIQWAKYANLIPMFLRGNYVHKILHI